jgi:hypothetical protein
MTPGGILRFATIDGKLAVAKLICRKLLHGTPGHHNRPEDMMVLCPNHHWEVTSGAMLEEEQRHHKARPFNIARGFADGLLKVNQTYCVIVVGSCELINDAAVVLVDGESLLSLSIIDQRLAISVTLYDEEDRVLLLIDQTNGLLVTPQCGT